MYALQSYLRWTDIGLQVASYHRPAPPPASSQRRRCGGCLRPWQHSRTKQRRTANIWLPGGSAGGTRFPPPPPGWPRGPAEPDHTSGARTIPRPSNGHEFKAPGASVGRDRLPPPPPGQEGGRVCRDLLRPSVTRDQVDLQLVAAVVGTGRHWLRCPVRGVADPARGRAPHHPPLLQDSRGALHRMWEESFQQGWSRGWWAGQARQQRIGDHYE